MTGPRPTRAAAAAALLATIAAGAVGPSELSPAGTADAASPAIDLRIRIAASARSGAPVRLWRLRCKPSGGDWPSVGPACRRLKPALLAPFDIETQDYGPVTRQPVRIDGRAFGKVVALRFPAMGSGTRVARLKALRSALGPHAFSEAERRSR